jgi:hypothetical protein
MPLLIKNISFGLADNFKANMDMINAVTFGVAEVECNHIKLGSFEGFLFNHKKVTSVENLTIPSNQGLVVNANNTFIELEISY